MFCYQCEQTAKGEGCTKVGVCGKEPEVAALQDLLVYALKGLSLYAVEGRKVGVNDRDANVFTLEAVFSTLTNVNFDPARFVQLIQRCVFLRDNLKEKVKAAKGKVDFSEGPATFKPAAGLQELVKQGEAVGIKSDPTINPDILSLQHILLFGLKGVSAYADHAMILGQEDDKVYAFIHEGLAATLRKDLGLNDWVGLVLKCGEINLRAMAIQEPMVTLFLPRFHSGPGRERPSSFQAMISKTWRNSSNRPKAKASMYIPTVKCFLPMVTPL
jgi:hydroxylamine reductase